MPISTINFQPRVPTFTHNNAPTRDVNEAEPKSAKNEKIYQDTFAMISKRYQDFSPKTELGYQQRPGVTADIEPISKQDLISILEHIKSDKDTFEDCKKKTAKAPFFNKFYLMSNADQGWNLRLHNFSVRGSGLGGDDSPHYHRWTLGSSVLAGGYLNVTYQEGPKTDSTSQRDTYSKYELGASKAQVSTGTREAKFISEAEMKVTGKTLYAQGSLNHFPITEPHSVETHAAVMGTTLTLAHTSKAVSETSIAFEKSNNIEVIPQIKIENDEDFKTMLQGQITHLQVLVLSDNLNTSLAAKFEQGFPLTTGEEKHLTDYKEPNYVETSLLPALAIYQMETINGIGHSEFSNDTVQLIETAMTEIDRAALDTLIANNQHDLYDKQLTLEIDDPELARQLGERANQAIAMH